MLLHAPSLCPPPTWMPCLISDLIFLQKNLTFVTPSGLTPRDNLNASDSSTAPPTPSPSASSSPSESSKDSSDRASRRRLNTLAARRYRQRRADRTHELEAELDVFKQERDALKMRVSKLEGEANALKCLLKVQNSKWSHSS